MSRHHYKLRDFQFAHLLVTLRRRASLTQEEVAQKCGVASKSIRNWEGGGNYPTEAHLQRLIEFYLNQGVFEPGREREEARALWEQFQKSAHRPASLFNEPWFAGLLTHAQEDRTSRQSSPERLEPSKLSSPPEEHVRESLPVPEPVASSTAFVLSPSPPHREDWGEVWDVSGFAGREHELAQLERWVLHEKSRLVTLLGMGGIGKTALATTFAQRVAAHFEVVIWRSLHLAPALERILGDCLHLLADQHTPSQPQDIDQSLSRLLAHLRRRRCLLVLDNVETLFQDGEQAGFYRHGYEEYHELFMRIGASQHQSCLLLTSRERISELDLLVGREAPIHVLKLAGLTGEVSRVILADEGLFADQKGWNELSERYGGNPLALKIVTAQVRELFGGDITAFLREGHLSFRSIRTLLKEQVERLSILEQEVLSWLCIERDLTSVERLRADIVQEVPRGEVLEALSSLHRRSLVERGERGAVFTLQPVVLEYEADRLTEQFAQEISTLRPDLLLRYALVQGQAKDYIRGSQGQLILQAVLDRLLLRLRNRQLVEECLERLLQELRTLPLKDQGYGGGNVVNLLARLNGHLKGKDCSRLLIRQADLQGVEAQDANFAETVLRDSVFLETINGIVSVALSPTAEYIAGGSTNGEIWVWRATDGQPLLALEGHVRLAWSLSFNPGGTLLASGGYDGLVKVWDISSGECLSILQGHSKWVRAVAFHPEGRLLATCSHDGSIRLWDAIAGRCIRVWYEQHPEIWSVAFSPNGKLLAGGDATGVVKLWNLESEQCLWTSTEQREFAASSLPGVLSIAFGPDSEVLVSGGEDGEIRVWEVSSGKHLSTLSGHTDLVYAVSFHPEGLLASGSFDGTVKLWQIGREREAARCLGTLQEHSHWLWSVAFGPQGLLVSGSQDGIVKLWQVNSKGGGKCLRTLRGYSCQVTTVALSPDGRLLVSGENNGAMRIWETQSGKCLHALSRQGGESHAYVFSPDGRFFATSSSGSTLDNGVQVWEADTGRCLRTLKGQQGYIWSMAFSPDGRFLLSGSVDTTIKRWEVSTGRCLTTFEGHHSWVWSLACSPNGQLLASGDMTGVVMLWQIDTGQCVRTLHGNSRAIMALAFTPDSQKLITSNEQDLITLWDVESGSCLKTIPGIGEIYWPGTVALSAGGNFLAVTSHDRAIKVWEAGSGHLLHTLESHAGRPWSVAWSADQRLLACGTDEGSILLWERQRGTCLMTLHSDRPYERLNIRDVTGITEAQRATLKRLGAIE